jgi:hypothetical protein
MKTKVTKLLMFLVAAASMGAFVSCKDTNEDLYNELRTELINENTTLAEALNNRIGELEGKLSELEAWKAQLEQWKESINSCNCPGNVQELINNCIKNRSTMYRINQELLSRKALNLICDSSVAADA